MENKGEKAQAHSHMCITVLYPRNTIKKGGRRKAGRGLLDRVPDHSFIHTHHHHHHHCRHRRHYRYRRRRRHCTSLMHFRRPPYVDTEMTISSIRRTM